MASICISALTTGYTAATISYGIDTDPEERRRSPEFYGYAPDDGQSRTIMFFAMWLNSALMLLIKSVSVALMLTVSGSFCVVYMCSDMALYMTQKVARGDFHHWLPISGVAGLFVSLLMRVTVKVVTDFTGIVHFRHSGELGGAYWSVNMGFTLVMAFVAVSLFGGSGEAEILARSEYGFETEALWVAVSVCVGLWLVVFGVFILVMVKDYRGSFWSFQTGRSHVMNYFLKEGENDAGKATIFMVNKKLWLEIREDVKAWTLGNWWRWEEEKPGWFNGVFKATIDDDFIPPEGLRELMMAGGGRRRSSIGELLERMNGEGEESEKAPPPVKRKWGWSRFTDEVDVIAVSGREGAWGDRPESGGEKRGIIREFANRKSSIVSALQSRVREGRSEKERDLAARKLGAKSNSQLGLLMRGGSGKSVVPVAGQVMMLNSFRGKVGTPRGSPLESPSLSPFANRSMARSVRRLSAAEEIMGQYGGLVDTDDRGGAGMEDVINMRRASNY